jgi:tetratricopeptide (TPR) repeat protein
MKTQRLILTIMMTAALAAPASAQPVAETAAAAREAAAKARAAVHSMPSPAAIAEAVAVARDASATMPSAQSIADAVAAAREAVKAVPSADVLAETLAAARLAAVDAREAATTVASVFGMTYIADQSSDREREAARAQREREDAAREKERAQRDRDRENSAYDSGQQALDAARWDRAVSSFDRVIELKAAKSDAALYWKAYAQNKLGQRPEALATIGTLVREYPKSRYLNDAKALEVEVKRDSGQPPNPAAETDEEIKIMAIQAMQHTASEEAIPMLQKVLQGTGSPKLKAQALFVLAQSNSPRAREVLVNIAKGAANPDLQMRAVRYLAIHGGRESRAALADIYASSSDIDMKKRILSAFMQGGEKDRLVTAAQSEQNPELRATAVQQLGHMGAHEELWAMYQKESTLDVKKQIIRSLFTGGSVTRLSELARGEQNPELRLLAVKNLGVMDSKRTGDVLVEIYNKDKDLEIRKAVISGLANSNNGEALVALARKESDMTMKKLMVSRLSHMQRSKVVTDFLVELINK